MRARFAISLVAVVIAVAVGAVAQDRGALATEQQSLAAAERAGAVRANQTLLDSLPALDGVRFTGLNEIEGPPGAHGLQWAVWYGTDNQAAAVAAAERLGAHVADWPRVVHMTAPDGVRFTARRGPAWLAVVASPVATPSDHVPLPNSWGVVVHLNAVDGHLYPVAGVSAH